MKLQPAVAFLGFYHSIPAHGHNIFKQLKYHESMSSFSIMSSQMIGQFNECWPSMAGIGASKLISPLNHAPRRYQIVKLALQELLVTQLFCLQDPEGTQQAIA